MGAGCRHIYSRCLPWYKSGQQPAFILERLDIAIDLRQTLLQRTLIFKHFVLNGVTIYLDQSETMLWHLRGLPFKDFATSTASDSSLIDSQRAWLNWLGRQDQLFVRNLTLQMHRQNGEQNSIAGKEIALTTVGAKKVLSATIQVNDDILTASAKGLYDHGHFLNWNGRITTAALDLENLCGLINRCRDRIQSVVVSTDLQWHLHDDHWRLSGPALSKFNYTGHLQQAHTISEC